MATIVSYNGSNFSIPANREARGWGSSLTSFLLEVAEASLTPSGGNYRLQADLNLGSDGVTPSSFGLVALYYKSVTANIAQSGQLRLARADTIAWRSTTNTDLPLGVSASDRLQFDSVNIPTISSTDTLTNKTLTSPVINSPTGLVKADVGLGNVDNTSDANKPISTATQTALDLKANLVNPTFDDGVTMLHESTPATPSSGRVKVYPKSDNNLYVLDSSGVETAIGSGGGSGTGSLNIVDNPSAVSSTTGWTAATNYTVSRDTSNSPLAGVIDSCFAISTTTASSETSTSGVYAASLAMPPALRNSKVQCNLWVTIPATADGVWRLSVYNSGGTRMSLDRDSSSVWTLPGGFTGQLPFTFDAADSATYTISFTQTARTSANTLYATLISIGNGQVSQTAPVGEIALTSSVIGAGNSLGYTNTTITNCVGQRVGSWLLVTGKLSFTGLPATGTGALVIRLSGSGLNIDSTKSQNWSGSGVFYDVSASGAIYNLSPVPYMTSSNIDIQFVVSGDTASTTSVVPASSPVAIANGDLLTFDIRIPIAEWAGSGTVNLGPGAQVEYAWNSDTTNANTTASGFSYGSEGVVFGSYTSTATTFGVTTKRVRFQYPIQNDDEIVIEINVGNGWQSLGTVGQVQPLQRQYNAGGASSIAYGMYFDRVSGSTTDIDVNFGQSGRTTAGTAYGAVGETWASISSARWRVRKAKASSPVGFGLAGTDGSSGLYQAGRAPGLVTGAAVPAGMIGEKLDFTSRTVTCTNAGQWYANTSALTTLTPGVWLVHGYYAPPAPTATVDSAYAMISTNNSNDGTGNISISTTGTYSPATTAIANPSVVPIVAGYVSVSANTPIYAKAFNEDRAGLVTALIGFAVRIA